MCIHLILYLYILIYIYIYLFICLFIFFLLYLSTYSMPPWRGTTLEYAWQQHDGASLRSRSAFVAALPSLLLGPVRYELAVPPATWPATIPPPAT